MYKPIYTITPRLLNFITQATELKTWISQSIVDVAWISHLQFETTSRLAHSSTAIEGNPLSLSEVESVARGDEISGSERSKQEVQNYLVSLKWIWSQKAGDPITESDLLNLHYLITQKTLPDEKIGSYKTQVNRVIDPAGHTIYLPPPPEKAQSLTKDLLNWAHSDDALILHPIIVSAIIHHCLVSIHPFSDGNGRIARALAIWILYSRGFDTHHLFALDEFFDQYRQTYYNTLQQARDLDDDLTYWIEYVAEGLVITLTKTKNRIFSLQITSLPTQVTLTKKQEDSLRFLRDKGRIKSPALEEAFNITRARVGQLLKPLIDNGIVIREGLSRATTYRLGN